VRYRTVFKTSPDAVMITGMDDGLVIDVNRGFVRMLGYEPEEVIGRKLVEMNHWVDPIAGSPLQWHETHWHPLLAHAERAMRTGTGRSSIPRSEGSSVGTPRTSLHWL